MYYEVNTNLCQRTSSNVCFNIAAQAVTIDSGRVDSIRLSAPLISKTPGLSFLASPDLHLQLHQPTTIQFLSRRHGSSRQVPRLDGDAHHIPSCQTHGSAAHPSLSRSSAPSSAPCLGRSHQQQEGEEEEVVTKGLQTSQAREVS